MGDRDLLDEHALSRMRLVAAVVTGETRPVQPYVGTARRVLAGLFLAVVACVVIGVVSYVVREIADGGERRPASGPAAASPRAAGPVFGHGELGAPGHPIRVTHA
jgi:hypothetical protein